MIHHILNLPVAATLTYEILDPQHEEGRFVVTPAQGGIPDSGAVYFIVDDKGRLQKIGKTDDAEGLGGRLNAYKVKSGGEGRDPQPVLPNDDRPRSPQRTLFQGPLPVV